MKKNRNLFGALALAALVCICVIAAVLKGNKDNEIFISYKEFTEMADNGDVEEVFLTDSSTLKFTLYEDAADYVTDNPRVPQLKENLLLAGISVTESSGSLTGQTAQTIISLFFFLGAFYFVSRNMSKTGMKSAMAINAEPASIGGKPGFSFEDVAGNDEAKDGLKDIVDFIKCPERFTSCGARMPRGVMFYGPPGTGKTLMAKAIAGEAGVPFYAVSGSDFVQMYVGVGAARIRDLFSKAREHGKAVIFIDEIDALGKKRGGTAGGNDERDQTLNALLTEMSGFGKESKDGIIVIAATNRLDTLDDALLRPGRFDRQIEIGLPDLNARERILRLHAKDKPIDSAVDLRALAADTVYFSGAMLENLLNEAAITAVKRGSGTIEIDDIDKAFYTVIAGSEKKDRSCVKEHEKRITAYHEAGHALVAKLAAPENRVSKITVIPSTKGAGGFCVNIPPDKMYYTKRELEAQIMVNLGGRAAEELIFGEENVTTGASNDIEKASLIARDYVSKYGMSCKSGLMSLNVLGEQGRAADECASLLERLYNETKALVSRKLDILENVARELMVRETLRGEELDELFS